MAKSYVHYFLNLKLFKTYLLCKLACYFCKLTMVYLQYNYINLIIYGKRPIKKLAIFINISQNVINNALIVLFIWYLGRSLSIDSDFLFITLRKNRVI